MTQPLVYETTVPPEWLDYNGHMNEAFYLLAFGHATDLILDAVGLDAAVRDAHGVSAFTVEAHVRYHREAREGDPLRIRALVAGADAKRMRLYHCMYRDEQNGTATLLATVELLLVHVATDGQPRSAPFRPETAAMLRRLAAEHADAIPEDALGRSIGMGR